MILPPKPPPPLQHFLDTLHLVPGSTPRRTPRTPLPRTAARPRPPHRHLLVPRRRHHRRLPPRLHPARHRRPPQGPMAFAAVLFRQLRCTSTPAHAAVRPRRHAHRPLRPLRRRAPASITTPPPAPPQQVRLRPRLGHPGLAGPPPAVAHPGPAAARRLCTSAPRTCHDRADRRPRSSAPSWNWPPSQLRWPPAVAGHATGRCGWSWTAPTPSGPSSSRRGAAGVVVVSRLRQDAALCELAAARSAARPARAAADLRQRAPRINLAKRAGQRRGWRAGGVRPVPATGDQDGQDVPGDLAAGRGRDPGGARAGGRRLAGVLLHRPGRVGAGHPGGDGGPDGASSRRSRTSRRCGGRVSSRCATRTPTSGRPR